MCVCVCVLFLGIKLSDFGSAVVVPVRTRGTVLRDVGREMAATAMEEQTHLRLLGGRGGNEGEYEGGREEEEDDDDDDDEDSEDDGSEMEEVEEEEEEEVIGGAGFWGTIPYASPEISTQLSGGVPEEQIHITTKSDVWAIGCFVLEVATSSLLLDPILPPTDSGFGAWAQGEKGDGEDGGGEGGEGGEDGEDGEDKDGMDIVQGSGAARGGEGGEGGGGGRRDGDGEEEEEEEEDAEGVGMHAGGGRKTGGDLERGVRGFDIEPFVTAVGEAVVGYFRR